jgi:hypothetical protein
MTIFAHLVLLASLTATDVQTDAADVDALARTLRIQIYETFRADRPEFDRRRQEAQRALDAWHAAGDRPEDRALLVDWYQRAVRASQPGSIGPLPESPRFGSQSEATTTAPRVTPPPPQMPEAFKSSPPPVESPAPEAHHNSPAPVETPYNRPTPEVPADTQPAEPPVAPQSPPMTDHPPTTNKRHLQISLVELSARLAGYNRGVQTIESKLSESRACAAGDLAPLVRDLADLARRGRDLSLYRDYLVTDSERETLPTLAALTDALALLGDRIFAARQTANGAGFAGSEADRQAELNRLDVLSRQLAEIATLEQTAASQTSAVAP